MNKTAIIGDIHGCYEEFLMLINKLPKDIEQIYTTGDLIDRGPNSKEVVQYCIDNSIISVKGNHEDMFIDYTYGNHKYANGIFETNGGTATLNSYMNDNNEVEIPDNHLEYLINMPYYVETDDFILSHAGVSIHIEKTFRDCSKRPQVQLIWDRSNKAKDLGKLQVYGHTPNKEVQFLKKWDPINEKDKIVGANIDTSGFHTGVLSAILVPSLKIIQTSNSKK